MKTLYQILQWYYRKTPTCIGTQDATADNPRNVWSNIKYEINVSKNGKHVFATDSRIRHYTKDEIIELLKLFRVSFPDCKLDITCCGTNILELTTEMKELIK